MTPLQHASARQFAIEGMTCQGCADTIRAAVAKIPGVQSVDVSLETKKAAVVADPTQVPSQKIEAAIADAGYSAQMIPGR